jgi:hypothetical protein
MSFDERMHIGVSPAAAKRLGPPAGSQNAELAMNSPALCRNKPFGVDVIARLTWCRHRR